MLIAALVVAVLALIVALSARAKAYGMEQELEDTRRDARRRVTDALEEVESSLKNVRELLAQVSEGAMLSPDQIRHGQLYRDLSPEEGKQMVMDSAPRIVDVRTPQETAMGIIPGALLIPIEQLEDRIAELPSDGRDTLIYCAAGGRSAAACEFLSQQGYSSLHNLVGGMGAWSGPIEKPNS
jgi:rhodanese-related sulfurtransferase